MDGDDGVISLTGPLERIDGNLVLRIPLEFGGAELAAAAKGISRIDGDVLEVRVPDWLAEKLRIEEGTMVAIDNRDGKFNIRAAEDADLQD